MAFALTAEQQEIRAAVARLCERFDDEYWLRKDTEGGFPFEFHQAMAEGGWLGHCLVEFERKSALGVLSQPIFVIEPLAQPRNRSTDLLLLRSQGKSHRRLRFQAGLTRPV